VRSGARNVCIGIQSNCQGILRGPWRRTGPTRPTHTTDSRITFDYYISRHVGIGGGLSTTDISVSKSGEDPFRVQYEYSGVLFYVTTVFF
jgi:hypothetical protein